MKFEKKHNFNRMMKASGEVGTAYQDIIEDIWKDAGNSKNYDEWHEEANYLCKLLLLYIDRFSPSPKAQAELIDFMKSHPSVLGVVDDPVLEIFNQQ